MDYTPEKYARILSELSSEAGELCLRMCEAPVVINPAYAADLETASREIIAQALTTNIPVPPEFRMETKRPSFFIVDFAMTAAGPKLIELQAFSSNLLFIPLAAKIYARHYGLPEPAFPLEAIRATVMGGYKPDEVVLMEIDPWRQLSRRDFVLINKTFGIAIADMKDIERRGRELFHEGRRIRRIYNRVVPGDYHGQGNFRFSDDLDVAWAGDPYWFFRISKAVLPLLSHPAVPKTFRAGDLSAAPGDLGNYVLKPAFLSNGRGVKLDVTPEDLAHAAPDDLLMEKAVFAPILTAPDGTPRNAEIRAHFIWPDEGNLQLAAFSARVMRGNDVNANLRGKDLWCGLAPVFVLENQATPLKDL